MADDVKKKVGRKPTMTAMEAYEKHKKLVNDKSLAARVMAREISEHMTPVQDPARRDACRLDFKAFCETYKRDAFSKAWSADHLAVIETIRKTVLHGGTFAVAMPRGSGKTSLLMAGIEWAVLYGHHKFAVLVCATEPRAEALLEAIIDDLAYNKELEADFPEACIPISLIGRDTRKSRGQLYNGDPTNLKFLKNILSLARIPGAVCSQAIIMTGGITGNMRGLAKSVDGRLVRPSLVLIDDPQTDESARSDTQCDTREKKVNGELLGLAGPGQRMAAFMACTVIAPSDLSDRYLDNDKHPEWQGIRTKMLNGWPETFDTLWKQYADIKAKNAKLEFYAQHRDEMDKGCAAAWPERMYDTDVSAIQHAMDIFFRDERSFLAEYQNAPLDATGCESVKLRVSDVIRRLSHGDKAVVPAGTTRLIGYADVGATSGIHWSLLALQDDFTGTVVAYGKEKIDLAGATLSTEAAIYDALTLLTNDICGRQYFDDGGIGYSVDAFGIDAGWQQVAVYRAIKASAHRPILIPGRGYGLNPGSEFRRAKGGPCPDGWRVVPVRVHGYGVLKQLEFHANQWKSFAYDRLTSFGKGAINLYGAIEQLHIEYALQLASESRTRIELNGKKADVWKVNPGSENHYWDTFVGAMVLARLRGAQLDIGNPGGVERTAGQAASIASGKPERHGSTSNIGRRRAPTPDQVRSRRAGGKQ